MLGVMFGLDDFACQVCCDWIIDSVQHLVCLLFGGQPCLTRVISSYVRARDSALLSLLLRDRSVDSAQTHVRHSGHVRLCVTSVRQCCVLPVAVYFSYQYVEPWVAWGLMWQF